MTCHIRVAVDGVYIYVLGACGATGRDFTAQIDRAIASFAITK
jgi:hypothetical protein